MSLFINTHNGDIYSQCNVTIYKSESLKSEGLKSEGLKSERADCSPMQAEDIEPVDTSFFCTGLFAADIIEKNLRQAIHSASSKADACRRIMALETQGYILLSNVKDERKAELINPFAHPKYTLNGEDFRKARNS